MFDPRALHKGDVLANFFHKAGFDSVPVSGDGAELKNVTPGWTEPEAIRRENLAQNDPALAAGVDLTVTGPRIDPAQYAAFVLANVTVGNRWVNEVILADQPVKLPVV